MDRNSVLGIVLIFGIFIGYFWLTQPSKKDQEIMKRQHDSIALVQKKINADTSRKTQDTRNKSQDTSLKTQDIRQKEAGRTDIETATTADSKVLTAKYGSFNKSATGKEKYYSLENKFMKVMFSNKGGRIVSVWLKDYKDYDGKPLQLFDENTSGFGYTFFAENRDISTSNLYFEPQVSSSKTQDSRDSVVVTDKKDSASLSMRLYPTGKDSAINKDKYIEFVYTLNANSFKLGYKVNFKNMQDIMSSNNDFINLSWNQNLRRQEKNLENERNSSTIYYKFFQDDVDNLSERKDTKSSLKNKIKWISFKDQFFTSVLIADNSFQNAEIKTESDINSFTNVKKMTADISIPYASAAQSSIPMSFYFGPCKYRVLKKMNLDLEKQIPIGWGFFLMAWINKFAVIPVFNFLEGFGMNYGIIILVLTILLKLLLFPIAYKTYISSAKMKILKPEIDEISAKFPKKDDALKKQQATMALYKKAGVSPLSGCVPMLLQFPILIAMFRFFPASIELRQQSFLWAKDLSSYDSILNLPFTIPFYGDHVSLFTLLMTASTIIYTMVNNQMMASSTQQMPGMKTMMYIMPVMFLGIFNNYSSGLSYYYFLANVITFAQIFSIKRFVNEDKLHLQIQANKNKVVKKSGWQKRLEEMAKQRGYNPNQYKKK